MILRCCCVFLKPHTYRTTVRIKKCNKCGTAALEKLRKSRRFLSPKRRTLMEKVPHFDGRATVHRLVKRRNPRIEAPFTMKMRRVRPIAAHLAKSAAISYPGTSRTKLIIKVRDDFHKSVVQKSGAQLIKIVAFFF